MDVISVYMRSIARDECMPLSHAKQRELLKAAQHGDLPARNRLVQSMLRYVTQWAQKYAARGLPLLDLVQAGALGVLRAIDKFDLSRQVAFSTYATFWIRQTMQRAIQRSPVVHFPFSSDSAGQSELVKSTRSLSDEEVLRGVEETYAVTQEPETVAADLSAYVQAAIDVLPVRQQVIVRSRMAGRTQSEIGEIFGISKERVRQLEADAHRVLAGRLAHLRSAL